tara:strand:+ start:8006 stop:9034 length:1029 start_codon:yes stop_codon:yes gene_type:complete
MSSKQADSDHIYYNVRIDANEETRKHATFSVNRTQAIVENPNEYELAVIRFALPLTSVPLIVFQDDFFKVSLTYGTSIYTESVVWVSNGNVYDDKYLYIVRDFIDLINTAYKTAFDKLKVDYPAVTSTTQPFMTFSSITNLIKLNCPESYLADNIKIYANENLYIKMNTFHDYYYELATTGPLNYQFIIEDLFDNSVVYNGITYLVSSQNSATIGTMSDLKSIEFLTSSIPVNRELQGFQKNITSDFLTDFEPIESEKWYPGGVLSFFPQGPLRYIDLLSNDPMLRFDLVINWRSKSGKSYPYYLQGDQSLTIKVLFRKKLDYLLTNFIDERIETKLEEMKV